MDTLIYGVRIPIELGDNAPRLYRMVKDHGYCFRHLNWQETHNLFTIGNEKLLEETVVSYEDRDGTVSGLASILYDIANAKDSISYDLEKTPGEDYAVFGIAAYEVFPWTDTSNRGYNPGLTRAEAKRNIEGWARELLGENVECHMERVLS